MLRELSLSKISTWNYASALLSSCTLIKLMVTQSSVHSHKLNAKKIIAVKDTISALGAASVTAMIFSAFISSSCSSNATMCRIFK